MDTTTHTSTDRVTRLEIAAAELRVGLIAERALTELSDDGLSTRLDLLERRAAPRPIDTAGWVKLGVAIGLPLAVLLVTGSAKQAASVAVKLLP